MRTVLFLCTGNYYRSRFAEHVFNHLTGERKVNWQAISRGLSTAIGPWKTGPISHYALQALASRGIATNLPHREPLYCCANDLTSADLVIALKQAEHQPLLDQQFPHLADRVEYWHVHDIDVASPDQALVELEQLVAALVNRLASQPTPKI
jgi:protein-tyrosine phosphatase